jgi:GNAT superfamily N-acetyltransferase
MQKEKLSPKDLHSSLLNKLAGLFKEQPESLKILIYDNSSSAQYTLEEFFSSYNPEEIGKGQCNLVFRIDLKGVAVASFTVKDMYNCCGIIVASDLFVYDKYRNMGVGTLITKFIIEFSTHYGYGLLQASDKEDSLYQRKIFEKTGWTESSKFKNPKTKNNLIMWLHNLN